MDGSVAGVYLPSRATRLSRPLLMWRVPAGFPSPAEDYVEGRIDLNRDLVKHPLATFYIKVEGDSMINAGIHPGSLLVVDRAVEVHEGHIVVARINDELCVKRYCVEGGLIYLMPENEQFQPILITEEMDFEIWGRVMYSIQPH
ncbi:MAG: polymerase [Pyrinomonadaceae bacterium]|nr:polymerase [Pyrinomonadaceae bacterium]